LQTENNVKYAGSQIHA